MRHRDFEVDFVKFFGYIFYGSPGEIAPLGLLLRRISPGKFFKGVHQTPHNPGGSLYASGGAATSARVIPSVFF